jgi:hypothetical protein
MTVVILLSLAAPLIAILPVKAADPSDWYMTVNGVLDSDYYSLYPYETADSLKVGFSKYGELINSAANVGLEYGDVDPFAYPVGSSVSPTVPKRMWVQGWLINITYTHRTLGARNVWATAIHADSVAYGNDWIRVDFPNDHIGADVEDPRDSGYLIYGDGAYGSTLVHGGRKTNGTTVTDGIEVLYDGPREFIAVCRTTISDHLVYGDNTTESDVALVQLAITIRFDKVKKDVVLLKDVKSLLVEKEGVHMKIQFSNRGEVDLGTATTGVSSYAHFWTQGRAAWHGAGVNDSSVEGQPTVYDRNWQIIQTENSTDEAYPYFSAAEQSFPQASSATYDIAQAVNPSAGYVWSAAFWPSLSDWTIDGWDQWWQSLMAYDPHYIDAAVEEPFIPFYIGEWDFVLYHTLDNSGRTQFRGVTQYSVTDRHDATDRVIDSEVQYYCNETFNPWDLQDAVHKETRRWLEWKLAGAGTSLTTTHKPVVVVSNAQWDDYCNFADRVIDYSVSPPALLDRGDYDVAYNTATGTATFSGLTSSHLYKILYSTNASFYTLDAAGPFRFFENDTTIDATGDLAILHATDSDTFVDPLGMQWRIGVNEILLGAQLLADGKANFTSTFTHDVYGWAEAFEVFKDDTFTGSWDYEDLAIMADENVSVDVPELDIHWQVNNPTLQDLYISMLEHDGTLAVTVKYVNITSASGQTWIDSFMEVTATVTLNAFYEEGQMGRYEWVTVGRDAKTVDNAGSALVAEAFDSLKEIQIGIAGADMAAVGVETQMPYVMNKFGTATDADATKDDYKDDILRAALKDDWCTYWPVASSNMIGTGGPIASMFAYYANDFTDAFYGLSEFAGTAYDGKITGIPCWNRNWPTNLIPGYNVYSSYDSSSTGYAVITTYKDINGTVIFNVWGHWGRDTYYATMWLHGDEARGLSPGIIELQQAPNGVTSIILEIDYTDPSHPTYSIPEVLGTISERSWYHAGSDVTNPWKGGIHDP